MYFSDQMLRNLTHREMTAAGQREADEQLGQIVAAVARWGHRVATRGMPRVPCLPGTGTSRPPYRKAGLVRRHAPYRA
jgi:hypothetical protein